MKHPWPNRERRGSIRIVTDNNCNSCADFNQTNIWFMYLSAKGIRNCITEGHDTVFLVSFIGYLLVGSGSFLFHATLKCRSTWALINSANLTRSIDPMQLVDELSMIYTTCLMCYVTFSFGRTSGQRTILAFSLVALSIFITLYYHVSRPDQHARHARAQCTSHLHHSTGLESCKTYKLDSSSLFFSDH